MKWLHAVAIAFIVTLALGGVTSSSAFGFLVCKERPFKIIKYEDEGKCLAMSPQDNLGAWALVPFWRLNGSEVSSATAAKGTGSLLLTDLKASFLGASEVECEGTLVGVIGPEDAGSITEFVGEEGKKTTGNSLSGAFIECKGVQGCEGNGKTYPVGLPWKTQLEEGPSGEALDEITPASGSSNIGYVVECSVFGIKEEDECLQPKLALLVANMVEEKDVLLAASSENAGKCSLSGENSGDTKGELLVTNPEGLSVSVE